MTLCFVVKFHVLFFLSVCIGLIYKLEAPDLVYLPAIMASEWNCGPSELLRNAEVENYNNTF